VFGVEYAGRLGDEERVAVLVKGVRGNGARGQARGGIEDMIQLADGGGDALGAQR
jgi:hypothetical protein